MYANKYIVYLTPCLDVGALVDYYNTTIKQHNVGWFVGDMIWTEVIQSRTCNKHNISMII